jgi:hypothetical protein
MPSSSQQPSFLVCDKTNKQRLNIRSFIEFLQNTRIDWTPGLAILLTSQGFVHDTIVTLHPTLTHPVNEGLHLLLQILALVSGCRVRLLTDCVTTTFPARWAVSLKGLSTKWASCSLIVNFGMENIIMGSNLPILWTAPLRGAVRCRTSPAVVGQV